MPHSPLHRPPHATAPRSLAGRRRRTGRGAPASLRSLAGLRQLAWPGLRGKASATAAACSAVLLAGGLAVSIQGYPRAAV